MISLSIHPLFVFDGPNKPPVKRHKRTGPNVSSIPDFLAKQLLKQFGLPSHFAPGEAEAECALLQQRGVVDAVLSEDVDTLMFGSGLTFRSWTPEPSVKTKSPTHVNIYDARETKDKAGLDRQGMILVAMMSGGDYIPEGVPGVGQKTACEAARARFGEDLCHIKKGDKRAMAEWKERLAHELKTNESSFFKQKHKTLAIPEDFPRTDVLGYYTNPVVSSNDQIEQLKTTIEWDQEFDMPGLRSFCADAFDWVCISGAKHFIRNLSRALLVRSLRMRADVPAPEDLYDVAGSEEKLIRTIHSRRQHPSTDNTDELRVGYRPLDIVPIDLDAEDPDPELPIEGVESDDEAINELEDNNEVGEDPASPRKKRKTTAYDPQSIVKDWVFETYVKVGVPLKMQDWEESFRNAKKYELMKNQRKKSEKEVKSKKARGGMDKGALDVFAKVSKPGTDVVHIKAPVTMQPLVQLPALQSDEMEPMPLTQSFRPFRPGSQGSHAVRAGVQKSSFRAPPALPPSSPDPQEETIDNAQISLLSSSPASQSVVPSKRPLRRVSSDPFQMDKSYGEITATLAGQIPLADGANVQEKPSRQRQSTKPARREPYRRTQTMPISSTRVKPCEPALSGQPISDSSHSLEYGSKAKTGFKKLPSLPPTPKTISPATPPRAKRTAKQMPQSPNSIIEITSSPASSSAQVKQQAITHFFSSSPPASPSPVRSRRRRELSPFYSNSGPEYDYTHLPSMGENKLEGAHESTAGQDNDTFLDQGKGEVGEKTCNVGPRKTREVPDRAALTATSGNHDRKPVKMPFKTPEERKRVVRLRDSLQGAFVLDPTAGEGTPKLSTGRARKGRRWRISEVEFLDLTGDE